MLRRFATSLAATSALVLTATAPALADHADPDREIPGNPSCEDVEDLDLELLGEKIDPPVDVNNQFYEADVSDDGVFLDVTAKEGFVIDAVLVKGSNAANLFLGPDFTHLFSPDAGASGEPAEISHYEVCGHEEDEENGEEDEENGEEDEENGETPEPKTTKTPAAVPTAVPAGMSGSGDASMAPVGIAAAALAMFTAGVLVRRRLLHQN